MSIVPGSLWRDIRPCYASLCHARPLTALLCGPLGGLLQEDFSGEWAGPGLRALSSVLPGPGPALASAPAPTFTLPARSLLGQARGTTRSSFAISSLCPHLCLPLGASAFPSLVKCLPEAPLAPSSLGGTETSSSIQGKYTLIPSPLLLSWASGRAQSREKRSRWVESVLISPQPFRLKSTSSNKYLVLAKWRTLQIKTKGCLVLYE